MEGFRNVFLLVVTFSNVAVTEEVLLALSWCLIEQSQSDVSG
jgi:hypothetical protein